MSKEDFLDTVQKLHRHLPTLRILEIVDIARDIHNLDSDEYKKMME